MITERSGQLEVPQPLPSGILFLKVPADARLYVDDHRMTTPDARRAFTTPAIEPGQTPTPYTSGPHGAQPRMGLGFFVMEAEGRRYIYHDGDQGGFSSELLVELSWP